MRLFDNHGIALHIAVATGKTVAKIAADGHKPDGLVVVPPDTEADFLREPAYRALPGIGPKTAARLEPLGLKTIGDLLDATLGVDPCAICSALDSTGFENWLGGSIMSRWWPIGNRRASAMKPRSSTIRT